MQKLVTCKNCQQQLHIDESSATTLKCPYCQFIVYQSAPIKVKARILPKTVKPAVPNPPSSFTQDDGLPAKLVSSNDVSKLDLPASNASLNRLRTYIGLSAAIGLVSLIAIGVLLLKNNDADAESETKINESNDKPVTPVIDALADRTTTAKTRDIIPVDERGFSTLPTFSKYTKSNKELQYLWSLSQKSKYVFRSKIQSKNHTCTIEGVNVLSGSDQIGIRGFQEEEFENIGACFFVHPEGLAVTCADLVADSLNVTVRYNDQWMKANVIAVDGRANLAILKLPVSNVSCLDVAQVAEIELATAIHSLGFDAGSNQDQSVKFRSGQVSGFTNESEKTEFQFDAKSSRGHSGGPILNDFGQVVGIATTLFQLENLNPVAMAVKSDSIFSLLRTVRVAIPQSERSTKKLEKGELSRNSMASVCLVKAKSRPFSQAIDYRAAFNVQDPDDFKVSKDDIRIASGTLMVTRPGEVLASEGAGAIGLFLVSPGCIGFEKMNPFGNNSWRNQSLELMVKKQGVFQKSNPNYNRFSVPSLRYRRYGFGNDGFAGDRFTRHEDLGLVLAVKTDEYEKQIDNDYFAEYKLTRTIRSIDRNRKSSGFFDASLSGTIRFDKKKYRLASLSLSGELSTHRTSGKESKPEDYAVDYQYHLSELNEKPYEQPSLNWMTTVLDAKSSDIYSVEFSRDSKFLFAGGKRIHVFDIANRKRIFSSKKTSDGKYLKLSPAKNSPLLIARKEKGELERWKIHSDGSVSLIGQIDGIGENLWSTTLTSKDQLLLAERDKSVSLWDLKEGKKIRSWGDFSKNVSAMHATPDGTVASIHDSRYLIHLDLTSGDTISKTRLPLQLAKYLKFSADGSQLFSKESESVKVYNPSAIRDVSQIDVGKTFNGYSVGPTANRIVIATDNGLEFWDTRSLKKITSYPRIDSGYVKGVVFSPSNEYFAIADRRGAIVYRVKD